MSGVSVSHLVLFIASLVVAAGVAGTLVTEVDRVSQSVTEHSDEVSDSIATDIEIISDTGSNAIYSDTDGNITILVKNTGSTDLQAAGRQVDVLVDGVFISPENITVERADGSNDAGWPQGSVVRIHIDHAIDTDQDHRVAVSVLGNEAILPFRP